jgi:hypothetical protein
MQLEEVFLLLVLPLLLVGEVNPPELLLWDVFSLLYMVILYE